MMRRSREAIGLALVVGVGLAGCGQPHLAKGFGRDVRLAFRTQAEAKSARIQAGLDARDARRVLAKHRGQDDVDDEGGQWTHALGSTGGPATAGVIQPVSSSSVGTPGTPIKLEAK